MQDFNIDDLIYSDFIDSVIIFRLKEAIYSLRNDISKLEMQKKLRPLDSRHLEDLEQDWTYVESLTKAYIFFSGDYVLRELEPWE